MIATQNPTYHALTGTQPIDSTQIVTRGEIAGTVTTLTRVNTEYWGVTVRSARNAFNPAKRQQGKHVTIWRDAKDGRYVVDYHDTRGVYIEADRTVGLPAAIGVAVDVATRRWVRAEQRGDLYR